MAFEDEQILHAELLVFIPTQTQPVLHTCFGRESRCWVKKIEYLLVVYLQERNGDRISAIFVRSDLLEEIFKYFGDDA
jgi:hypothetical protein